jgi:small conductance mechanosensitive channel
MNQVGVRYNLEELISSIVSYVIYLFTIILFLDKLGIRSIVLYLLVGAILMLIILTFLVGLKDIIPNFVAWLILQKKEKIKEGKYVKIKNISGRVERVGFLETEIKTESGDILYVPNSLFLKSKYWVHN